jgi:Tfp pilus assembly protein PilF
MPRRNALLLAALVGIAACQSDEEEARGHLARAEERLAAGEASAAFIELRSALALDPTSARINFLLGEALRADRQPGKARFYYQEARRLAPERIDAYLAEASLLARVRPSEARELLDAALEREPESAEAWRLSAVVSLADGNASAALYAARRASTLAPEDFEVQLTLGRAHAASARPGAAGGEPNPDALAEALAAFERARALADEKTAWRALLERARLLAGWPERAREAPAAFREMLSSAAAGGAAPTRVAAGEAALRAGRRLEDPELQRAALEAILAADPSRLDAWQGLASLEAARGGDAEAIYRRLLDARSGDPAAQIAWARYLASQERTAEAVEQLRQGIEGGLDPPVLRGALLTLQLEDGDEAAARATLAELEREHPQHPRTALAVAQLRLHDGKVVEAAEGLRVLVGTHDLPEAQRLLALAELRSGKLEAATAAIDRALALAPGNPEALRLRARIRYRAGSYPEALKAWRRLARVSRLSAEERLLLARCLYETGEPAAGRKVLESLLAPDTPHAPAALELARREANRDPEAAERALVQAEAVATAQPGVLHELTLLDAEAGRAARALARLERAAAAGPLAPPLRLDRAQLLLQLGRKDEARAEAEAVFEASPGFPGASELLLALYDAEGRLDEFSALLEGANAKGELRPASRALLGRVYTARGENAKARAIFEELLSSGADLPLVKSDLAYLLALDGVDLERAQELAQDALGSLSDEPEVLDTMGYVELRRGNPAAAVLYFEHATALTEETGRARAVHYYHLGLARRAAGRDGAAVEAFDRALALEPDFPDATHAREERALALAGKPAAPRAPGSAPSGGG